MKQKGNFGVGVCGARSIVLALMGVLMLCLGAATVLSEVNVVGSTNTITAGTMPRFGGNTKPSAAAILTADATDDAESPTGDRVFEPEHEQELDETAVALSATFHMTDVDGKELAAEAVVKQLSLTVTVAGEWGDGQLPRVCVVNRLTSQPFDLSCEWTVSQDEVTGVASISSQTAPDGSYYVEIIGTDHEGNVVSELSPVFTLDTTVPELSIACSDAGTLYEGVAYFDKPVTLTIQLSDTYLDLEHTTVDDHAVAWELQRGSTEGLQIYSTTLILDEGQMAVPTVRARDLAGNTVTCHTLTNSAATLVVDLVAPVIEEVQAEKPFAMQDENNWWFYDQQATLTFTFADAWPIASAELHDSHGLYTATPTLSSDRRSGTLSVALVDGADQDIRSDFDRDVFLTVRDVAGNKRVWSLDRNGIVSDAAQSDSTNVSINGWDIFPRALVADMTPPVVAIAGVEAGAVYATAPVVRVTVAERNFHHVQRFDAFQAVVQVTRRAADATGSVTSWSVPASDFVAEDAVYMFEHSFGLDGHYALRAELTDIAGNISSAVRVDEFTVDTTAPVISVTFDNRDAKNGYYYAQPRTATVTVDEHNFDAALIEIDTEGVVHTWTAEGDRHSCIIDFPTDASYHLTVHATDRAGNEATPWSDTFVVDATLPTIAIQGVVEQGAYNATVAPHIVFADEANFDRASVNYEVLDADLRICTDDFEHEITTGNQEYSVAFKDFAHLPKLDGIYTLTASVCDLAGNRSEVSKTFSVNRFGSTFMIDAMGGESAYEAGAILDQAPEIVIREVNVSGVVDANTRSVMVTQPNGVSRDLPCVTTADEAAGFSGYTIDESKGAGGWHEYVYRIGRDSFASGGEGRYLVNVISTDAADNHNTTSIYYDRATAHSATAEVEFILDTKGPAVELVQPHIELTEEYVGNFRVVDDIQSSVQPDVVEVVIDGQTLSPSSLVGPDMAGGYSFRVMAQPFVSRSVVVTVTDHIGRNATASSEGFMVIAPAHAIGVAAVLALLSILAIVVLFLRKRARAPGRAPDVSYGCMSCTAKAHILLSKSA